MSWFETVKNVAKTVAENIAKTSIGTGGIPCAGASIAGAVPSTHSGLWSYLKRPSISVSDSDSDSDSQEEASSSTNVVEQVTTRARYTYELDRFQKNALLMFVQMRSESSAGSRVEETTTQDINILQDTLNGFRFEVTTYIDLSCSEIENKCQEFFQQNFSEFGAVIVVVLTFQGGTDQLSALDGSFSENIILRHFTNDLNLTLHGKPKIYITETHRILSSESGPRISIPLEENQDVLGLHFPTIDHQTTVRRPMVVLCDNIKQMADTHDFATILKKSVEEIKTSSSVFENSPIELSINFAKEMMLARSAE